MGLMRIKTTFVLTIMDHPSSWLAKFSGISVYLQPGDYSHSSAKQTVYHKLYGVRHRSTMLREEQKDYLDSPVRCKVSSVRRGSLRERENTSSATVALWRMVVPGSSTAS